MPDDFNILKYMVLLEVLVEDRSRISSVLVLPNYASKKHSTCAELATSCRKQIEWIIFLRNLFFFWQIFQGQWQHELNKEGW